MSCKHFPALVCSKAKPQVSEIEKPQVSEIEK